MFEVLKEIPQDKILSLMAAFREDPRDRKVDLGVGVYKDATGLTPVMRAVKAAERRLVAEQTTKVYTKPAGDPEFADAMIDLILGPDAPKARIAAAATPGGTGAIRQALELIKLAAPTARIWMSDPTWPNHPAIAKYLGMTSVPYRYFDTETRGVDFAGMMADLEGVAAGDVVLLHGCCHNPTGANLDAGQWRQVIALLKRRGAVPLVDIAYQGFGDGLEEDAAGTRAVLAAFDECMIAASCSKNFGLYRERTGLLLVVTRDAAEQKRAQTTVAFLNRQNFSFPPDHGARVVTMILTDPELRADWEAELEEVRTGMLGLRQALADELKRLTNSDRFAYLADHRGMFSLLGTGPDKVEAMRAEHGIYMVSDSRMNIAGLNAETIPVLARAIVATGV